MSTETKQDIADACAVAMLPVFITAVVVMDALLYPYLYGTFGFFNAAFIASIIAGALTGISYLVIAVVVRILIKHIRRSKN